MAVCINIRVSDGDEAAYIHLLKKWARSRENVGRKAQLDCSTFSFFLLYYSR